MDNAPGSAQTSLQLVEAAPFLSVLEFEAACDSLAKKYQDGGWNEDSLGLHIQVRLHTSLPPGTRGSLRPLSTCRAAQAQQWRPRVNVVIGLFSCIIKSRHLEISLVVLPNNGVSMHIVR